MASNAAKSDLAGARFESIAVTGLALSLLVFAFRAAAAEIVGGVSALAVLVLPLTVVSALVVISRRHGRIPQTVPLIVGFFALLVPGGVVYASLSGYSAAKVPEIFLVTMPLVAAGVVLVDTSGRLEQFNNFIAAIGGSLGVFGLLLVGDLFTATGRQTLFGLSPLQFGRIGSLVAAIAVVNLLHRRHGLRWVPVMFLGVYLTLSSGSRGPALGLTAAIAVAGLMSLSNSGMTRKRRVLLGGFSVGAFLAALRFAPERTVDRALGGLAGGGLDTRGPLFDMAWEQARRSPLGLGFGDFAIQADSGRAYAHNFFLELAVEAGLVAALAGILLVGYTAATCWRYRRSWGVDAAAPFVTVLSNALVSGDLNDNRILLVYCFIIIGIRRRSEPRPSGPRSAPVVLRGIDVTSQHAPLNLR